MDQLPLEIQITGDGSFTLYSPAFQEIYHSRHGAFTESQHVFIEGGLKYVLEKAERIQILEVGFGTGLNAWLTALALPTAARVMYIGLEPFPVSEQMVSQLNFEAVLPFAATLPFSALHQAPWNVASLINPQFELLKIKATLEEWPGASSLDLVYFDAFAPEKHPALWELPVFEKIAAMMHPQGVLVSYCAKGQFKRHLKAVGFAVESLPGPPGKREMTRAIKL
ncbi:MAG: tRNA (5-methylaminomethyl-2-thiouridine)(34)-methyltransferase MnmD [Microscillaceae bacterium]|nr:tRNA (5-methylaminomethyl-2-thiouridine)(34)-methyltransferase MnmD [Microscillaceae bacterium]